MVGVISTGPTAVWGQPQQEQEGRGQAEQQGDGDEQGLGARARRDILRRTWVPMGKGLKRLEDELGVIIRFVVGYRCATSGTRTSVHGQSNLWAVAIWLF